MNLVKAHALGNDFLLVEESEVPADTNRAVLARRLCERHRGVGADGLITYATAERRASMRLLNADGSRSEISGNGVRCLAAWIAEHGAVGPRELIRIETEAGLKTLELLDKTRSVFTFRAAMGAPEQLAESVLDVDSSPVSVVTLRVGNPQCVVLGTPADLNDARLRTIGARLAVHPSFPEGTNVELAAVETPERVRILIWERGVGPTKASGTGACAAAVAAIACGGAARDVEVIAPGGSQRVEWREDGLYLTGTAELIAQVRWMYDVELLGSAD
jgi:diaminopimelate epimerase